MAGASHRFLPKTGQQLLWLALPGFLPRKKRPGFGKRRQAGRAHSGDNPGVNVENIDERKFINSYVGLTGSSESQARCVYMFLDLIMDRLEPGCASWAKAPDASTEDTPYDAVF